MTVSQEKLRVGNVLDNILQGEYDDEGFAVLAGANYGTLKYFKEKYWLSLSVLETGMIRADTPQDFRVGSTANFNPVLVKKTFEMTQRVKVPPHYTEGTQQLRNAGHTLREAAIRGAVKTLSSALIIEKPSSDILPRIAQIATSVREVHDLLLIKVFDVLLHFGADLSVRNHAVIKNIDATLGGTSLLFKTDIQESEVLSFIDEQYFPFFQALAKHDVAYVTPLTLKYHLLVTDQTPFDYLIKCKEEERPVTLALMGA